jgi:hypothetical protein
MDKSRSDTASGAETKYAFGAHAFTHDIYGVRVAQSLIFNVPPPLPNTLHLLMTEGLASQFAKTLRVFLPY